MAILINADTKVITQGITGAFGALHTKGCLHYGTQMVGGVTPGKGGQVDANGLPIFNTVRDAVEATGADATMIFVPPAFSSDAILEAMDAGVRLICCITEGVPVNDMIRVRAIMDERNAAARGADSQHSTELFTLIGPNCPGIITPGPKTGENTAESHFTSVSAGGGGCKIGIMPGYINTHISEAKTGKAVGIVSRSGTLTYEAVWQTSQIGLAQSTCIGIGGDPVRGINHIDCLRMFEEDPDTHGILMIGEIGGEDEEHAAEYISKHVTKPVAAFIAGRTAPEGKRMGHAGAIISAGPGGKPTGTADTKIEALRAAGVEVALSPAEMGIAMAKAMKLEAVGV
ncbi:MAG: succinate--CoA ligase subunit alpha [Phycisphaerales bacterium]|nr:succinate--CoA ligase subunit alpha [Phycisphaerales bacterium]